MTNRPAWHSYNSKFNGWREYQKETVDKILESDKKFFVLQAPTGSGKSLIAMEVARYTFDEMFDSQVYYLVQTKNLQKQIQNDFPVKLVMGRNNFDCLVKETTCDNCIYSFLKQRCPVKGECPYYRHKNEAMESQYVIWNYSMFITNQTFVKDFPAVNFMVCDEGHLIESVLMGFIEIKFDYNYFHDLGLAFPGAEENVFERVKKAKDFLERELARFSETIYMDLLTGDMASIPNEDILQENMEYERKLKKTSLFGKLYNESWMMDYHKDRWNFAKSYVSFKPLMVSEFSDLIFNWAEKILIMSATLPPKDVLVRNLGLDADDIEYYSIPSTFKKENRPVIYAPVGSMAYADREITIVGIADWIREFLEEHPDDKILIHTVNYWTMKALEELLAEKDGHEYYHDIYLTEGDGRESAIETFKESERGAILISPSVETGLDLPYEECRFQIITKVPYLSLGDKQVKKRMEMDRRWYLSETANRMVQASGRIVRAKDDYGTTYILDSCFEGFVIRNKDLFPDWFLESIAVERGKNDK